jgi:transcriptional/translational regulatory protein YebC/TACO1
MSAEVSMVADMEVDLDKDGTARVLRMIDKLEENDDVQNVYNNLAIPDDYEAE